MKVSNFHFELPKQLIARYPTDNRTDSKLLHLDAGSGAIQHLSFKQLPGQLNQDDLLVLNNTRVIPARLFGRKDTGGRVEILLERVLSEKEALAQVRASKSLKPSSNIHLEDGPTIMVTGREGDFYRLVFPGPGVRAITESHGHVPLPPYIERADEAGDLERYQTVYASISGSVAAPTAGLHFDDALLQQLDNMGVARAEVTLHVGAGTFQPIRVERVEDHRMHKELIDVPASVCEAVRACKAREGRIVAVGTTSLRCLESASAQGDIQSFKGDTDIFIYPGYEFRCVDALVTNFHLPGSTLLMLVSAFAGIENIKHAYAEAIRESYRFFSYGDAMLITR